MGKPNPIEKPKNNPGISEESEALQELKAGIKETAPVAPPHTDLEHLRKGIKLDNGLSETIKKLSFEKAPDREQLDAFHDFQAVLASLPQSLLRAGVSMDELKTLGTSVLPREKIAALKQEELAALNKIFEMQKYPDHPFVKEFVKRWPSVIGIAVQAKAVAERITGTESKESDKKETPAWRRSIDNAALRAKETMQAHPWITAGVIGAGVIGAGWLIKKMFSSKEKESTSTEQSEDSTLWKWTKRLMLTAGILVGVGSILEMEGVKKFFKDNFGIDANKNTIYKALTYLSAQNIKKFLETLFEGDKEYKAHKKIAEKISKEMGKPVSPELLMAMKKQPFNEFDSWTGKGTSFVNEYWARLKDSLTPELAKFFMGKNDTELSEEEKVVRAYIEKHRQKVNAMPKNNQTTVIEVLAFLADETKTLEEAQRAANPELNEKMTKFDEASEKVTDEDKKNVAAQIRSMLPHMKTSKEAAQKITDDCKKRNIDSKKFNELHTQTQQQFDHIVAMTADPSIDANTLADQGDAYREAINQFNEEQERLLDQLAYHSGWTEFQYMAYTQGINIPRRYFKLPDMQRNWVRARAAAVATYPLKKMGSAGIALAEKIAPEKMAQRAEKAAVESLDDLKAALTNKGLTDPKDIDAIAKNGLTPELRKTLTQKGIMVAEIEEIAEKLHYARLDTDVKQWKVMITEKETELASLKKTKTPDDLAKGKITKLEQEIKAAREAMEFDEARVHGARTKVINRELETTISGLKGKEAFDKIDMEEYWKKLNTLQDEVGSGQKILEREVMKRAEKIAQIRSGVVGLGSEEALRAEMNKLLADFQINERKVLQHTVEGAGILARIKKFGKTKLESITGSVTETAYHTNLKKLAALIGNASQKQGIVDRITDKAAPKLGQLFAKSNVSRIPCYAISLGMGTYLQTDETAGVGIGKAAGQTALDIMPVLGEASDFYSAFTGEEGITGRKLDMSDRGIRLAFGIGGSLVNLASGAAILTGVGAPLGAWGRAAFSTLKAGKLAKNAGKIAKIAEAGAETAQGAQKITRTARMLESAGKAGRTIQFATIGGVLGKLGYDIIATPDPSKDIPVDPATAEVLQEAASISG